MYCRICGNEEGAIHRPRRRQVLCASCSSDTPAKVARARFDRAYWNGSDDVPEAIKREFYSDYLASTHTLAEYIEATTEPIGGAS
jgi:hypothetical protein